MKQTQDTKDIIVTAYSDIAKKKSCCCGSNQKIQRQTKQLGYSEEEISKVPTGSNLGLGCGNPVAIASLKEGEVVLDLGSGAGFDAFLASPKVGENGKVIGIDMSEDMLVKARANAKKGKFENVEFRKGDIENLPVEDNSVDVIISNCVINLAPDKEKVFKEMYRALKPGGRLMVSDTVLSKTLPEELKNDKELLVGCVSGAILKENYFNLIEETGFSNIILHKEVPGFLEEYSLSVTYSAFK
jgi:arsenite methyltransferase